MKPEPDTGSILRIQFFVYPTRTGLLLLWLYAMLLKTNPYRVEKTNNEICFSKYESGTDSILVKTMRRMEHEPGTGSILRLQFFVNPTLTELLLLWLYTMLLKTNPYRVEKQIMKFCIPKRIRHGFDFSKNHATDGT